MMMEMAMRHYDITNKATSQIGSRAAYINDYIISSASFTSQDIESMRDDIGCVKAISTEPAHIARAAGSGADKAIL